MIEVKNLTKRYGAKKAVDNISFEIKVGEIVGFLGPNGAGKTTTMNILTGYLSATDGVCKIDGVDILEEPVKAKQRIGFLPEQPPLYTDMTVSDYLSFVYDFKKATSEDKKKHIAEVLALINITAVSHRLIKNLSKGYRQRVGLAQALIGNPEILILDEPTVGLDPKQIIEIRTLIQKLRKGHTIILSSHILPEVAAVCDRVLVINEGKIIADDKPASLAQKLAQGNLLTARLVGNEKEILSALKHLPNVKSAECVGTKESGSLDFVVEGELGVDLRRSLFSLCRDKNFAILMLKQTEYSLEDVFISLVNSNKS